MHHYGDNFIPVVPEEHPLHTPEHPFCGDPTCLCLDDPENRGQLAQAITDGLLTPDDALQIVKGKMV